MQYKGDPMIDIGMILMLLFAITMTILGNTH